MFVGGIFGWFVGRGGVMRVFWMYLVRIFWIVVFLVWLIVRF